MCAQLLKDTFHTRIALRHLFTFHLESEEVKLEKARREEIKKRAFLKLASWFSADFTQVREELSLHLSIFTEKNLLCTMGPFPQICFINFKAFAS